MRVSRWAPDPVEIGVNIDHPADSAHGHTRWRRGFTALIISFTKLKPHSDPHVRHPLRSDPPHRRVIRQSDRSPIVVESPLFDRQDCSAFRRGRHDWGRW